MSSYNLKWLRIVFPQQTKLGPQTEERERECSVDSWAFSIQLGNFLLFFKVVSTANHPIFFCSFLMFFSLLQNTF